MKNKLFNVVFLGLLSLVVTGSAIAQQDGRPIKPPEGFSEEGIRSRLSPDQLEDFRASYEKSDKEITRLLSENKLARPYEAAVAVENLINGYLRIIAASGTKQTEILLRYLLKRAVVIATLFEEGFAGLPEREVRQGKLRQLDFLRLAGEDGIKFYHSYFELLEAAKNNESEELVEPDYAAWGTTYKDRVMEMAESIHPVRAQYNIMNKALGFYHMDLKTDKHAGDYGEAIAAYVAVLYDRPEEAPKEMSDSQLVQEVRALRGANKLAITEYKKAVARQLQNNGQK